MKNKCSGWFTLNSILGYIAGVGYCFTLILIPLAVYCFIGARRNVEWSEMSEGQVATHKKEIRNWSIFFSIAIFPLGLFSIAPAIICSKYNVVITNVEEPVQVVETQESQETEKEEQKAEVLSDEETIAKLKNLLDEGLITEEEFARAKKEIIDK